MKSKVESSIFAFSAASVRRCKLCGSVRRSMLSFDANLFASQSSHSHFAFRTKEIIKSSSQKNGNGKVIPKYLKEMFL